MKKLILAVVVAVAAFCGEAAVIRIKMPLDENGRRCEGDCDATTPCRYCNPPKRKAAKKAAKKTAKTPRKRAEKRGENTAKTPSKRAAKKPPKDKFADEWAGYNP